MQVSFFILSDWKKKPVQQTGVPESFALQAAKGFSFFLILQEITDSLGPGVSLLLQMSG